MVSTGRMLCACLAATASLSVIAIAGPRAIGMTSGQNGVTIDGASVAGNATVFDGSEIHTSGYSLVEIGHGSRLGLGAGAQAQVFSNRAALENGLAEIQSQSSFEIDAGMVKVVPSDANSIARVRIADHNTVLVAALNAPVSVSTRDGLLVAKVMPGVSMSFLLQPTSPDAYTGTGCVVQKSGAAIFSDENKGVYELRGANLKKAVGNTVHVVGKVNSSFTAASPATKVVMVTSSQITKNGGCDVVAKDLGATTAAAGLAAAATTGAATIGAAGAAAAGAAAAGGVAAGAATGLGALAVTGIVVGASALGVGVAAGVGAFKTSP